MNAQIIESVGIFDVIDACLVVLTLLEMILDFKALNPLWSEVVPDDLGLAQLVPYVATFLVKNYHTIGSCERIEVW